MSDSLVDLPEWQALKTHSLKAKRLHLSRLFAEDPERAHAFTIAAGNLTVDYSKNRITRETMSLLMSLSRARDLGGQIRRLFSGEKVNTTENRPALHTALRHLGTEPVLVEGWDVMPPIRAVRERMMSLNREIAGGTWRGFSGKAVKDVVHIGIGGSGLGPEMAVLALRPFHRGHLRFHFVSNVDPTALDTVLRGVDPERVLFVVVSKTFTTMETIENAQEAKRWLIDRFKDERCVSRHFLAVTAAILKAHDFGIPTENILETWDWVGGRFMLCSAAGMTLMLAVGEEGFMDLLRGCYDMDCHFRTAPWEKNLPIVLALLDIWNYDFLSASTQAVLPYSHDLRFFPAYLQQLIMESGGKSVNIDGNSMSCPTAPVVWGGTGTDGQHAFFQLLHQGTHFIPCDFIGFLQAQQGREEAHRHLLANLYAQTEALAFGKSRQELQKDGVLPDLIPFKILPGDRPSTTILAQRLTPFVLGQLVALYEHRVFVQAAVWGINPFDQWGVELGKSLAAEIAQRMAAVKNAP